MNLITNMCFPEMSYMNSNIGFSKNKPRMKLIISLYKLIILNIIANMYMQNWTNIWYRTSTSMVHGLFYGTWFILAAFYCVLFSLAPCLLH